jgi:hypothetical protein
MELVTLALTIVVYLAAILGPLVLLPLALERYAGLPYNSVRSRLMAWGTFAGLMASVALSLPADVAWNLDTWVSFVVLVLAAAGWDLYDMKTRRIPAARHPLR